jgi:hypothetical protein
MPSIHITRPSENFAETNSREQMPNWIIKFLLLAVEK